MRHFTKNCYVHTQNEIYISYDTNQLLNPLIPSIENRRAERCLCEDKLIDNTINRSGIVNRVSNCIHSLSCATQQNRNGRFCVDTSRLVTNVSFNDTQK